MINLNIKIDVKNFAELIKIQKGETLSFLANALLSREKQKEMVEEKVKEEVVKGIYDRLKAELEKNGVEADIKIE